MSPDTGGDGGSDGSVGWDDLPDPLSSLSGVKSLPKKLLTDPRLYIIGVIVEYVAGGITRLLGALIGSLQEALFLLGSIPTTIGEALLEAGALAGGVSLTAIGVLGDVLAGLVASAGPASPLVMAAVAAGLLYATFELAAMLAPLGTGRLVDGLRRVLPW
ncbi:hypothetical protein [Halosimplex amylolyticum]|uniref:hypothetical protein n=1 Tax=Halosimplex amylolyticum TaxID=3396616 RepID=UPI003F54A830